MHYTQYKKKGRLKTIYSISGSIINKKIKKNKKKVEKSLKVKLQCGIRF